MSTDFHAWWLKRRGLAQGYAFLGICSHCSPLTGSKKQFWGVNRRFQAKLAKSKNVHIIKTTASIPTTFCTVIKNTKCPSWVVPTHALQIQDGGLGKIEKLLYLSRSLRDFDEIWHDDAVRPSWLLLPLKIKWNFENPRWRRPPSWKIEK